MLAEKKPKQKNSSAHQPVNDMLHLQAIALEASANAIAITDSKGIIQWINPAFTRLTGYSAEEAIGQNPRVLKSGVHDKNFYANMWQMLTKGEVWQSEIVNRKKDGTLYHEEMTITPVRATGDEITNYIAVKQDISERKEAEKALKANKAIINSALDAVITIDIDGIVSDWNGNAEQMFGWSSAEAIGRSLADVIIPEQYREGHKKGLQRLRETGEGRVINRQIEIDALHRDGHEFPIEMALFSVDLEDSVSFSAFIKNITERKQAEAELQLVGQRSRTMLEAIMLPLLVSRIEDGSVLYANKQVTELIGLPETEAVGRKVLDFYDNPQDRQEILEAIKVHGGVDNKQIRVRRADGEPIWVLLSNRQIYYENELSILTTLVNITAQKEAEDALANRAAELEIVSHVSAAAATILETDALLDEVVNLTKERFDLYHAHIYLLDPAEDTLILAAGAGEVGRKMVAEQHVIPLNKEQSLVAQAARTRQGTIENDVLHNPAFLPHPLLPGTCAEMTVPMLVGDRVVGVLDIQASEVGRFSQQNVAVMSTLAAQIGVALENARSFENAQRALLETETLLDVTRNTSGSFDIKSTLARVLDTLLETLTFDAGLFSILNSETHALELLTSRLPDSMLQSLQENGFDGSLCDMVFQSKEMVCVRDLNHNAPVDATGLIEMGYKSYQGVPLINRGEVLGTLCLFSKSYLDSESTNENLLKAIGQQVGTAVQTVTLFEQSQRQAQRLAKLNEMSTVLNQAISNDEIYQIIGGYTQEILAGDRASLALVSQDKQMVELFGLSGIEGAIPLGTRLPIAGTGVGLSINERRLIHFPKDAALNEFPDTRKLLAEGMQNIMAAPLIVNGQITGSLNLASKKPFIYGESELSVMQQLANLVSSTLQTRKFLEDAETQADELQTVADLSATVTSIQQPQELLDVVVQETQRRFNLYHCHIFLLDETNNHLQVHACGWQESPTDGAAHGDTIIPLDAEKSLVAQAARTKTAVVVNDVRNNPYWLPNELLPDTRAEMAVPMLVGGRVIGVLDVQSDTVNRFSEQDKQIQTTLAAQTAVALQNARSYDQVQTALAESKQAQKIIQERETLLRTIIDSTPDWIFVKDREHRYRLVNQGYADTFHINPDDFIGKNDLEIGFPEDIVKGNPEKGIRGFWPDDQEVIESGEMKIINVEPAAVDGEERFLHTVKAPLRDAGGNIIGVVGFVHNITDRIQAEAALKEEQERTITILESVNVPMVITRMSDGTVAYLNEPMAKLMRVSREESIGRVAPDFYADSTERQFYVDSLRKTGQVINHELKMKRDDGEVFWALMSGRTLLFEGTPSVVTSIVDITERQIARQTLVRRAAEMETVAQVGTAVATIHETERLLSEVVNLTKEQFGLYHSHIYLLNTQGDTLVLVAGAGEVGRQMVAEKRQIPFGQTQSLVAQVARSAQGVIENDVRSNPAFLPHPLLPDTRSEMAVPMISGSQVVGVLDVQSDAVNRFSEEDVTIQTTLASQIAVALENARLHEEAQMALNNLNELTRRLTREGWEAYLKNASSEKVSYIYDAVEQEAIAPLTRSMKNGADLHDVNRIADVEVPDYVMKPLFIHGEPIGEFAFLPGELNGDDDIDAAEIIEAVTDQLSGHIENLRLTEQSQAALFQTEQQAQRLSMLNEMGAELSRADMLDEIHEIGVAHTAAILEADQVTLGILAPSHEHLEFVAAWGRNEQVQIGVVVPVETNDAIKTAVRQNRVVSGRHSAQSQSDGLQSFMTAPLMGDNRVIGVLNVGSVHGNHFFKQEESLILQISSLLGAAIERQRLAELTRAALDETQRRSEELALINRVMSAVTGSLNLSENLKTVARELVQAISVSHVSIALMSGDQKELEIVTEYPLSDEDNLLGQKLPIKGYSLTEQALETRKFVVAYDAQNNPLTAPFHDLLHERGVHTLAVLPMAIGNEIFGTVGFDILDPDRIITDEQMRLAETIVYHTTTVVQNARLFTQTEQRLAELTVIQESLAELTEAHTIQAAVDAFLPRVLSAVDADSTLLFLFNDDKMVRIGHLPLLAGMVEEQTRVLPIEMYPLIGDMIKSRDTFYVQKDDPRLLASTKKQFAAVGIVASAFVPLVSSSGVIGVMLVNLHRAEKGLSQHDIALLLTLSSQMSIAMERIRLLEATRQRAEREQMLRGIAAKVRNTTQVDSVMRTAVQEIGRALGRKTFLYFDPETKEKE